MVVKTLFLCWVDLEEMRKVMNHSWFHRIRRLLETGVTITLPFGTFTFEPDAQAGVFVLLHLQRYSFLLYQTLLTISILFFTFF